MISCSLHHTKINQPLETAQDKMIEFEEVNHVNVNLIDSEYKIVQSQADLDRFYRTINENNPSPRKSPIPSFNNDERYIVLQPKIGQTDFTVEEVSENGENLKIKIQQYDNPEFKNLKYPASIIKIANKRNYKIVQLIK